jgi:hypothetical protein
VARDRAAPAAWRSPGPAVCAGEVVFRLGVKGNGGRTGGLGYRGTRAGPMSSGVLEDLFLG